METSVEEEQVEMMDTEILDGSPNDMPVFELPQPATSVTQVREPCHEVSNQGEDQSIIMDTSSIPEPIEPTVPTTEMKDNSQALQSTTVSNIPVTTSTALPASTATTTVADTTTTTVAIVPTVPVPASATTTPTAPASTRATIVLPTVSPSSITTDAIPSTTIVTAAKTTITTSVTEAATTTTTMDTATPLSTTLIPVIESQAQEIVVIELPTSPAKEVPELVTVKPQGPERISFTDNGIFDFMTPDRAIELYKTIASDGPPDLEWKCHGRRKPGDQEDQQGVKEVNVTKECEQGIEDPQEQTATGFDFDDEDFNDLETDSSMVSESLRLKKRESGTEKRTNLSDIMSDIMKESHADGE